MEIRKLYEHELNQLLVLYNHLHEDDDALPAIAIVQQKWRKILSNDDVNCYGLFIHQKLVCSCCLVLIENLTRGCRPYAIIENVVTHGDFRRQGLGKALLKHSLSYAWLKNCYKVVLSTSRLDEEVFKFYESVGFNRYSKQAFVAKP